MTKILRKQCKKPYNYNNEIIMKNLKIHGCKFLYNENFVALGKKVSGLYAGF